MSFNKFLLITLPLPPRELHPNGRAHWTKKAIKAKRYRRDAGYATLAAINNQRQGDAPFLSEATVQATFYYAKKNRRDPDNLLASLKAAFDGIVDSQLIINDFGITHLPVRVVIDKDQRVELLVTWRDS